MAFEPMTPAEVERWKSKQIAAAIERGVNPLDAQNAVNAFMAELPPGADPNTYIVPAHRLEQNLTADQTAADLRADWYGDEGVPPRFKRILDTKGT